MYKQGTQKALLLISRLQHFDYKEDERGGKLENRDLLIRYNRTGEYNRVYLEILPKVAMFQKYEFHITDWQEDTFIALVHYIAEYKKKKNRMRQDAILKRMAKKEITNNQSKSKRK